MSASSVSSFIIRFVEEPASAGEPPPAGWRGLIRHVQSNQQMRFSTMEQALAFMNRYVALEAAADHPAGRPRAAEEDDG